MLYYWGTEIHGLSETLFTLKAHTELSDFKRNQNGRTNTCSDDQIAVVLVILDDGHQIPRRNLPLADLLENLPPLRVVPPQESLQILQIIYRNGENARTAEISQQTHPPIRNGVKPKPSAKKRRKRGGSGGVPRQWSLLA